MYFQRQFLWAVCVLGLGSSGVGPVCAVPAKSQPVKVSPVAPAKVDAAAQVHNDCMKLLDTASEALTTGNVGVAHSNIDQAMELLNKSGGDNKVDLASCYATLAHTQITEGLQGLADDSFKQALDLRDAALGPKNPIVLQTCKEYADLLEKLGRKDEASKLRDRVAAATVPPPAPAGGGTKPRVKGGGTAFDRFVEAGQKAAASKNSDEALADWESAAAEAEKTGSRDRQALAMVHVGDQYMGLKNNDQAMAAYKKGIELRQQMSATGTLGMARNLKRLATMYMVTQNYSEAERLLNQALDIENQCGAGPAFIGTTLQGLVPMCNISGEYSKANQLIDQLNDIADKISGPLSTMLRQTAMGTKGSILVRTGHVQEGQKVLQGMSTYAQVNQSPEQIKAVQDAYLAIETQVDESEEKAFK